MSSTEGESGRVRCALMDCWLLWGPVRWVWDAGDSLERWWGVGNGFNTKGAGHCHSSAVSPVLLSARVTTGAHLPALLMTAGSWREL